MFCKAPHEPHSGLGDLKLRWPATAGACGVRRESAVWGWNTEYLDLPAARLIDFDLITKGFEDLLACGCGTTDPVRYHLVELTAG